MTGGECGAGEDWQAEERRRMFCGAAGATDGWGWGGWDGRMSAERIGFSDVNMKYQHVSICIYM